MHWGSSSICIERCADYLWLQISRLTHSASKKGKILLFWKVAMGDPFPPFRLSSKKGAYPLLVHPIKPRASTGTGREGRDSLPLPSPLKPWVSEDDPDNEIKDYQLANMNLPAVLCVLKTTNRTMDALKIVRFAVSSCNCTKHLVHCSSCL